MFCRSPPAEVSGARVPSCGWSSNPQVCLSYVMMGVTILGAQCCRNQHICQAQEKGVGFGSSSGPFGAWSLYVASTPAWVFSSPVPITFVFGEPCEASYVLFSSFVVLSSLVRGALRRQRRRKRSPAAQMPCPPPHRSPQEKVRLQPRHR